MARHSPRDLPDELEIDICEVIYSDGDDNPLKNVRRLHELGYYSTARITNINPAEKRNGGADSNNLSLV